MSTFVYRLKWVVVLEMKSTCGWKDGGKLKGWVNGTWRMTMLMNVWK